jgi:hypothetical protein
MTTDPSARFQLAIDRFDAANAQDPAGKELAYARRMTQWLQRLEPNASEALRLAARSQHIRRWEIPRASFPMDRPGYLKWRKTLYEFHATKAGEILHDVGYDDATIARVQSLLRKEKIKLDPEMQTLEDVICLVFLEYYFEAFAAKHDDEKLVNILRRTWRKMSDVGHAAALQLTFADRGRRLIAEALKPSPADSASASSSASSSTPGETEGS